MGAIAACLCPGSDIGRLGILPVGHAGVCIGIFCPIGGFKGGHQPASVFCHTTAADHRPLRLAGVWLGHPLFDANRRLVSQGLGWPDGKGRGLAHAWAGGDGPDPGGAIGFIGGCAAITGNGHHQCLSKILTRWKRRILQVCATVGPKQRGTITRHPPLLAN